MSVIKSREALAYKRSTSILPKWVLDAISFEVYDRYHHGPEEECNNIEISFINTFEEHMLKGD